MRRSVLLTIIASASFCAALDLHTISYSDLTRRVVDLEIEEKLTHVAPATDAVVRGDAGKRAPLDAPPSFEMNPLRIVGLAGDGRGLYMEYVFGNEETADETQLAVLTEQLAGNVFQRFPEVESLYLRRCTRDTFTDTIVNRD